LKKSFPGYFALSDGEIKRLWDVSEFSFDTNVLIDACKSKSKASSAIVNAIKQVSDRIWLSNWVAREFLSNRVEQSHKSEIYLDQVLSLVRKSSGQLQEWLNDKEQKRVSDLCDMLEAVKEKHDQQIKPSLMIREYDKMTKEICKLFNERVGAPYTMQELLGHIDNFQQRFNHSVPPGYCDTNKTGFNRYGDVIIWYQLLDRVKSTSKSMIFVSNDFKSDWQETSTSPRQELVQEMHDEANVQFWLIKLDTFVEKVSSFCDVAVSEDAMEEIRADTAAHADSNVWWEPYRYMPEFINVLKLTGSYRYAAEAAEAVLQSAQRSLFPMYEYQNQFDLNELFSAQREFQQIQETMKGFNSVLNPKKNSLGERRASKKTEARSSTKSEDPNPDDGEM